MFLFTLVDGLAGGPQVWTGYKSPKPRCVTVIII